MSSWNARGRAAATSLALSVAVIGCGGSRHGGIAATTGLQQAAILTLIAGDGQSGAPGTDSTPLVVSVRNSVGEPLIGVTVDFAFLEGNGAFTDPSPETDAAGMTSTILRFGGAGPIRIRAAVNSAGSVDFTAMSVDPRSGNGNGNGSGSGGGGGGPAVVP
jgi:hypothetical protein